VSVQRAGDGAQVDLPEEVRAQSLADLVDAEADDDQADGDDQRLAAGPGQDTAHRPLTVGRPLPVAEGRAGGRDGEEAVDDRRAEGLAELGEGGTAVGAGIGERGVVPQHLHRLPRTETGQADRQGPQHRPADRRLREQRHRPALVDGVAGAPGPPGVPGQLQGEPGDQQVHQRVPDQPEPGHVPQGGAARRPVHHRDGVPVRLLRLRRHPAPVASCPRSAAQRDTARARSPGTLRAQAADARRR
jgi:hypothetical protein